MVRSLVRASLVFGALACFAWPVSARAAVSAAEREGARLSELGASEEANAQTDKIRAEELERQGKATEDAAEKKHDASMEDSGKRMQQKADAMKKAAEERHEAAEEILEAGNKLTKEGAKHRAAEEKAQAMPDR